MDGPDGLLMDPRMDSRQFRKGAAQVSRTVACESVFMLFANLEARGDFSGKCFARVLGRLHKSPFSSGANAKAFA